MTTATVAGIAATAAAMGREQGEWRELDRPGDVEAATRERICALFDDGGPGIDLIEGCEDDDAPTDAELANNGDWGC